MPHTDHFKVEILVGDRPIPEYEKDGNIYVESNLNVSGLSYHVRQRDRVGVEYESQRWPVTPYKICILPQRGIPKRYFDIFVDGVKVKSCSADGSKERIISGFKDKNCVREFLFSLPRFAKDEEDRLTTGRETRVSTIEVECYDALLMSTKVKSRKQLNYDQANKKDCVRVTQGQFTMSTTKVGNVLYRKYPHRVVHVWRRLDFLSKVTIHYRMGHSLQEMGFRLKPYLTLARSGSSSDDDGNAIPSTSNGKRHKPQNSNPKKLKNRISNNEPIVLRDSDSDADGNCVQIEDNKAKLPILVDLTGDEEGGPSESGDGDAQVKVPSINIENNSWQKVDACIPRVKSEKNERSLPKLQRTNSDSPLLRLSHNSHENSPIALNLPAAQAPSMGHKSGAVFSSPSPPVSETFSNPQAPSDSSPYDAKLLSVVSMHSSPLVAIASEMMKSPLAKCTTVRSSTEAGSSIGEASVSITGSSPLVANVPLRASTSSACTHESENGENGGYAVF
ncbi:uncharacterized protein LOC135494999 [Lineus longissimus]|uniref:uncharacterized protein LOC135494999 n=1 Tax=Lineus longissimus TaxID=88925 RepID=UPI002B4F9E26